MTKSATDVMQEVLAATVLDAIAALKAASGGLPNNLLRDINAIHANTTFADLPKELQASVVANVRSAFTRLLKEGYSVSTGQPAAPRSAPRHDNERSGPRPPRRNGPGRGPRPGGERPDGPPGGGGRPGRGPRRGGPKS
jgi:hypothetical protein